MVLYFIRRIILRSLRMVPTLDLVNLAISSSVQFHHNWSTVALLAAFFVEEYRRKKPRSNIRSISCRRLIGLQVLGRVGVVLLALRLRRPVRRGFRFRRCAPKSRLRRRSAR